MTERSSTILCLLFWEVVPIVWALSLDASFRCVHNEGRVSAVSFLVLSATDYVQRPDVVGISLVECSTLCAKRGLGLCNSFGYNPKTRACYTKNVNSNVTGYLCGVSYEVARYFCESQGQTYVAFGGVNQTMMECSCGGSVDTGAWPNSFTVSRYDCIDECKGKYPCSIQNGPFRNCQICTGLPTTCGFKPFLYTNLIRALCTTI